ncbi:MAG: type II toxin-antitoxin system VapC family toxin [Betaproteobacteria bacterium]
MAASVLVDASFVVALIAERDAHRSWAVTQARSHERPWLTCEAALSESFYLLGRDGAQVLAGLLRQGALRSQFDFSAQMEGVLGLMEKYADVPMSLADACLVRMTEILPECVLLTTDSDFRIYRRHSRRVVPYLLPE